MNNHIENLFSVELQNTKKCSKCKQIKLSADFYDKSPSCRICDLDREKKRYAGRSRPLVTATQKTCPVCKNTFLACHFYPANHSSDGLSDRCRKCNKEKNQQYRKTMRLKHRSPPAIKTCRQCKRELDYRRFSIDQGSRDGLCRVCKECTRIWLEQRQSASPTAYLKKLIVAYPRGTRVATLTMRKSLNAEFLMSLWEKQDGFCPYTGIKMTHCTARILDDPRRWTNVSIDRIDSTRGYEKDNVHLVCFWANSAKSHLTESDFKKWIDLAAAHMKV